MQCAKPWPDPARPSSESLMVHTSARVFADRLLGAEPVWSRATAPSTDTDLARSVFGEQPVFERALPSSLRQTRHLLAVADAPRSHVDVVNGLCSRGHAPASGTLLLAERGSGFHGHHGRAWEALPGNLHLTAYYSPNVPLDAPGATLTALPASVVIRAIDSIADLVGRARIKWMNDILIDGAKVAGVLCFTTLQGRTLSGILVGIGLNVETRPTVASTPFVPRVAALSDFASHVTLSGVFAPLCAALDDAVSLLCDGHTQEILDAYRRHSVVLGRQVEVWPDKDNPSPEELTTGVVTSIGDHLELTLEPGSRKVVAGRVRLL